MSGLKPLVVKIGGNALGPEDTTIPDLVQLRRQGVPVIVAHGGGPTATQWLQRMGVETTFVQGRRVTDPATLEVVTAVFCGLINKTIVAAINGAGGKAVGVSGVDGCLVTAAVQDPMLGRVGEVDHVDPTILRLLVEAEYIPVVAPISFAAESEGGVLNVNADSVAGSIAQTVGAERLIFLTDVPGIHDAESNTIPVISRTRAREMIATGVISGGMVPKVEACLSALDRVPLVQVVDGRRAGALREAFEERTGTRIFAEDSVKL